MSRYKEFHLRDSYIRVEVTLKFLSKIERSIRWSYVSHRHHEIRTVIVANFHVFSRFDDVQHTQQRVYFIFDSSTVTRVHCVSIRNH